MNKLKVGDIVYIAAVDEIHEVEDTDVYIQNYKYYEFKCFLEKTSSIHEHLDLGFIIKLEL
jgi:hypothetical protein